jgi:transcriptional regulator of acetoin/glycerol metabolism
VERAGEGTLLLDEVAERALLGHAWPGNVRELRNRIERAAILAAGPVLEPASLAEVRDAAEREHIRRVLLRCGGRVQDAARGLGIARTTLWEKMRRPGVAEAQTGGAAEKP